MERISNSAIVFLAPLLGSCAGAFAIPHLRSYTAVTALFVLQGISMGMLDTGGNVIILALWRGSTFLNSILHALHFFFGFGALVGPLLVNAWLGFGHDRTSAWSGTGALIVPCCLGFLVLIARQQPKIVAESEGAAPPWNRTVLLSGFFLFVYMGAEVSFGGLISAFTEQWLRASEMDASNIAAVYWGMLSLGLFVAAALTSYVNHARYMAINLVVAVVAMVVMLLFVREQSRVTIGPWTWWCGVVVPTAFLGLAFGPLFPGMMLIAEERLKGPLSGRAASFMLVSAAAGEALLPVGTGVVYVHFEPIALCWTVLVLSSGMGVIFLASNASLLCSRGSGNEKSTSNSVAIEEGIDI